MPVQKAPVLTILNSTIDHILINSKYPGITLAVYCFIERSEENILKESFIAKSLKFDFYDVILSLNELEKIKYIKINQD